MLLFSTNSFLINQYKPAGVGEIHDILKRVDRIDEILSSTENISHCTYHSLMIAFQRKLKTTYLDEWKGKNMEFNEYFDAIRISPTQLHIYALLFESDYTIFKGMSDDPGNAPPTEILKLVISKNSFYMFTFDPTRIVFSDAEELPDAAKTHMRFYVAYYDGLTTNINNLLDNEMKEIKLFDNIEDPYERLWAFFLAGTPRSLTHMHGNNSYLHARLFICIEYMNAADGYQDFMENTITGIYLAVSILFTTGLHSNMLRPYDTKNLSHALAYYLGAVYKFVHDFGRIVQKEHTADTFKGQRLKQFEVEDMIALCDTMAYIRYVYEVMFISYNSEPMNRKDRKKGGEVVPVPDIVESSYINQYVPQDTVKAVNLYFQNEPFVNRINDALKLIMKRAIILKYLMMDEKAVKEQIEKIQGTLEECNRTAQGEISTAAWDGALGHYFQTMHDNLTITKTIVENINKEKRPELPELPEIPKYDLLGFMVSARGKAYKGIDPTLDHMAITHCADFLYAMLHNKDGIIQSITMGDVKIFSYPCVLYEVPKESKKSIINMTKMLIELFYTNTVLRFFSSIINVEDFTAGKLNIFIHTDRAHEHQYEKIKKFISLFISRRPIFGDDMLRTIVAKFIISEDKEFKWCIDDRMASFVKFLNKKHSNGVIITNSFKMEYNRLYLSHIFSKIFHGDDFLRILFQDMGSTKMHFDEMSLYDPTEEEEEEYGNKHIYGGEYYVNNHGLLRTIYPYHTESIMARFDLFDAERDLFGEVYREVELDMIRYDKEFENETNDIWNGIFSNVDNLYGERTGVFVPVGIIDIEPMEDTPFFDRNISLDYRYDAYRDSKDFLTDDIDVKGKRISLFDRINGGEEYELKYVLNSFEYAKMNRLVDNINRVSDIVANGFKGLEHFFAEVEKIKFDMQGAWVLMRIDHMVDIAWKWIMENKVKPIPQGKAGEKFKKDLNTAKIIYVDMVNRLHRNTTLMDRGSFYESIVNSFKLGKGLRDFLENLNSLIQQKDELYHICKTCDIINHRIIDAFKKVNIYDFEESLHVFKQSYMKTFTLQLDMSMMQNTPISFFDMSNYSERFYNANEFDQFVQLLVNRFKNLADANTFLAAHLENQQVMIHELDESGILVAEWGENKYLGDKSRVIPLLHIPKHRQATIDLDDDEEEVLIPTAKERANIISEEIQTPNDNNPMAVDKSIIPEETIVQEEVIEKNMEVEEGESEKDKNAPKTGENGEDKAVEEEEEEEGEETKKDKAEEDKAEEEEEEEEQQQQNTDETQEGQFVSLGDDDRDSHDTIEDPDGAEPQPNQMAIENQAATAATNPQPNTDDISKKKKKINRVAFKYTDSMMSSVESTLGRMKEAKQNKKHIIANQNRQFNNNTGSSASAPTGEEIEKDLPPSIFIVEEITPIRTDDDFAAKEIINTAMGRAAFVNTYQSRFIRHQIEDAITWYRDANDKAVARDISDQGGATKLYEEYETAHRSPETGRKTVLHYMRLVEARKTLIAVKKRKDIKDSIVDGKAIHANQVKSGMVTSLLFTLMRVRRNIISNEYLDQWDEFQRIESDMNEYKLKAINLTDTEALRKVCENSASRLKDIKDFKRLIIKGARTEQEADAEMKKFEDAFEYALYLANYRRNMLIANERGDFDSLIGYATAEFGLHKGILSETVAASLKSYASNAIITKIRYEIGIMNKTPMTPENAEDVMYKIIETLKKYINILEALELDKDIKTITAGIKEFVEEIKTLFNQFSEEYRKLTQRPVVDVSSSQTSDSSVMILDSSTGGASSSEQVTGAEDVENTEERVKEQAEKVAREQYEAEVDKINSSNSETLLSLIKKYMKDEKIELATMANAQYTVLEHKKIDDADTIEKLIPLHWAYTEIETAQALAKESRDKIIQIGTVEINNAKTEDALWMLIDLYGTYGLVELVKIANDKIIKETDNYNDLTGLLDYYRKHDMFEYIRLTYEKITKMETDRIKDTNDPNVLEELIQNYEEDEREDLVKEAQAKISSLSSSSSSSAQNTSKVNPFQLSAQNIPVNVDKLLQRLEGEPDSQLPPIQPSTSDTQARISSSETSNQTSSSSAPEIPFPAPDTFSYRDILNISALLMTVPETVANIINVADPTQENSEDTIELVNFLTVPFFRKDNNAASASSSS